MTDKVVKQIQRLLDGLGHSPGKIDGIWGSRSQAALDAAEKQYCKQSSFDTLVETTLNWWKDIKYFNRSEFACPCGRCGGFPVEPEELLVRTEDKVRAHFGKAAHNSSGVRCKAHNDELPNSAKQSRHLYGKAVDFRIDGVSSSKLLAYVKTLPDVRYCYAIDGSYVHMDIL